MSEKEYLDNINAMYDKDRDLAEAFRNEYKNDPQADKNTLMARANAALGRHEGLQGVATGKNAFPLMQAFGLSDAGMRDLVDMRSPSNWTKMSTKALMDAAVKGGYVKSLPKDATEEEKQEQRNNFGNFLNVLATESADQERRNVVKDYENTKFTNDPVGWSQKVINDFLFRTYSKRAIEQALNGQGATGWGDMSWADRGTLVTDAGVDVAMGAGAATLGRAVAGNALRSGRNIVGSDIAAGLVGGSADVANRALNTEEGVRPYEYVTEPAAAAATNALFTPGALMQGINSGMAIMRGGRVGDVSRRTTMTRAADWLANKTGWDEAGLASLFKEMGSNGNFSNSPMSAATRKKVEKMKEIWDDGLSDSPGETYSLYDELQQLYESTGRQPVLVETGEGLEARFVPEELDLAPTGKMFLNALDDKIADLKGALKNTAGAEDAPALRRRIEYFENARDMFGNGLMDPEDALHRVDKPSPFEFSRKPSFVPGSGAEFVLRDATTERDLRIMKEYVAKAKERKIVDANGPMADVLSGLAEKYPEFGRFVDNMRTVRNGTGLASYASGPEFGIAYGNRYAYGSRFAPSGDVLRGAFSPRNGAMNMAGNVGTTGAEAVLTGLVKPAATFTGMERFNRPDNSYEAVSGRIERLRAEKPEATEAAINWKYDPRLPQEKQLNEKERNLVNQYRAMLLNEAMNGR